PLNEMRAVRVGLRYQLIIRERPNSSLGVTITVSTRHRNHELAVRNPVVDDCLVQSLQVRNDVWVGKNNVPPVNSKPERIPHVDGTVTDVSIEVHRAATEPHWILADKALELGVVVPRPVVVEPRTVILTTRVVDVITGGRTCR